MKTIKHKKSKKTWISNDLKVENNQLILANKQENSKIGRLTKNEKKPFPITKKAIKNIVLS